MKLVRFGPPGHERPGVLLEDGARLDCSGFGLDWGEQFFGSDGLPRLAAWIDQHGPRLPQAARDERWGPPIARPSKIIGIGLNYLDHAREMGIANPSEPVLFQKASSALAGPFDDLPVPPEAAKLDWEVELGVVIGRTARHVAQDAALSFVVGYVLTCDYSERAWQKERGGQFTKGKSHDGFAPMGPFLATADEVRDPQKISLWLDLNGEPRQRGTTHDMIFGVAQLVSYTSHFMTLLPGDVISTGTPAGVGLGAVPPRFLKAGDVVELGADGLGSQRQAIVDAGGAAVIGALAAFVLGAGLVVVAPREFVPALGPYLEHRRGQMAVEVLVVEDVAERAGADAPERLKRILFERWKAGTCSAVLLVGDVGFVPVRWMTLDRVTPAAFDTAFYPSDLYYGDLAREDGTFDDWNGAREGAHALYFGEVHGEHHKTPPVNFDAISYLPEIAVGRWPARTGAEAAACAAKTIAFERQRAPERRAAFVHKDGWVDVRARLDALVQRFPADRAVVLADSPGAPVGAARVGACLREGITLALHTGHASPGGWDGALGLDDRAALAELAPRSILVSAGCSSATIATEPPYGAYLDVLGIEHPGTGAGEVFATWPPPPAPLQPAQHDATSLGEELVRGPGPVAAYFGCVTGAQPCAVTLVEEFAAALPTAARLGDLWLAAVRGYHERENLAALVPTEDWYPASIYFQAMKFVLLGDPTLAL